MIIDNNISNYKNKDSYNKVVAIALACIMGMSTMISISAAGVEEKVSTGVSSSKNTSNKLNYFKDLVVRKNKEIAAGVGGAIGVISLAGCIYQTVMKNKIMGERDEANLRADQANIERNSANIERDEANLRANTDNSYRNLETQRAEQANRERNEANQAVQQANVARDEAIRRADQADADKNLAIQRADQADADKNLAIQRANQADADKNVANQAVQQANAARDAAIAEQHRLMGSAAGDARRNVMLEQTLLSAYNGMPILKGASIGYVRNGDLTLNYGQFKFLVDLATGQVYQDEPHTPIWQPLGGFSCREEARNMYISRIRGYINPNASDRNKEHKMATISNLKMTESIAAAFFDQIIERNYEAIATNHYQDIRSRS